MRVLVLDPGERVGWATAEVGNGAMLDEQHRLSVAQMLDESREFDPLEPVKTRAIKLLTVQDHGISFLKDMALAVYRSLIVNGTYDVVVCEDWRLSARHAKRLIGSNMQSSQFIGMVRLCCWVANVQLVMQPPAAMSTAERALNCGHPSADDIRHRLSKLPKSHDDSHDGSALLHLWAWFFGRYV